MKLFKGKHKKTGRLFVIEGVDRNDALKKAEEEHGKEQVQLLDEFSQEDKREFLNVYDAVGSYGDMTTEELCESLITTESFMHKIVIIEALRVNNLIALAKDSNKPPLSLLNKDNEEIVSAALNVIMKEVAR